MGLREFKNLLSFNVINCQITNTEPIIFCEKLSTTWLSKAECHLRIIVPGLQRFQRRAWASCWLIPMINSGQSRWPSLTISVHPKLKIGIGYIKSRRKHLTCNFCLVPWKCALCHKNSRQVARTWMFRDNLFFILSSKVLSLSLC